MLLSPTLQYRYVGLIYGWGLGEKDGLVTSSNGDVQMHKTPRVDGGQKQHRSKHNEPPPPPTGYRAQDSSGTAATTDDPSCTIDRRWVPTIASFEPTACPR